MFDPRGVEVDAVKRAAANTDLEIRYAQLPAGPASIGHDDLHHYDVIRERNAETFVLAQRLTADEALAFLEGYRFGQEPRGRNRVATHVPKKEY